MLGTHCTWCYKGRTYHWQPSNILICTLCTGPYPHTRGSRNPWSNSICTPQQTCSISSHRISRMCHFLSRVHSQQYCISSRCRWQLGSSSRSHTADRQCYCKAGTRSGSWSRRCRYWCSGNSRFGRTGSWCGCSTHSWGWVSTAGTRWRCPSNILTCSWCRPELLGCRWRIQLWKSTSGTRSKSLGNTHCHRTGIAMMCCKFHNQR